MSEKFLNDSSEWKNNIFLDLPFWREIFTDPKTSQRADTYHTRKNTEQANRLLEAIKNKDSWVDIGSLAQALQRPQEEIQHLMNDMVWNQKNTEHIIAHTGQQTQEWLDTISSQVAAWALEIKSTLEQLLWHEVPKNIPLHVLGRTLTAEWKQSLIALAAKWAVNPEKLSKVISPQFAQYMKEGISSTQARRMQESILLTLQALKNGTSAAHRKYHQFLHDTDPSMKMINQDRAKKQEEYIQEQTEKYENLARQLVSEDELALLDVAHYAKDKSIGDMLAENVISPALASRFAKNGVLDGRFAKIMTNMFDVKDGKYRPLVEMDGIAGIWQWTKANALMKRKLVDLQGTLVHQWILSLSKQDRALMKQDKTNKFLDNIDKTIVLWTQEFREMRIQTHDDLGQIDRSLTSGFGVANTHLGNINTNLKTGFNTANTYLQNMDTNIFHGFQGTHNLLSNIHKELASRHQEVGVSNQYLAYAGEMLDSIDTGISFANEQLGDIAYYTQATTELLHGTNQLIAHSNQLQIITNHQLENIQQQIVYSRAHLTNVLQAMTGALVGELRDIKQALYGMWQLQYVQIQQNRQALIELQRQSTLLEHIDQKLLQPNQIKANEYYKTATTRLQAGSYDNAIQDLSAAVNAQSTHSAARYALAIAHYHNGDMWAASRHFVDARLLAAQNQDMSLLAQICVWQAKIELKAINPTQAIAYLEEALIYNPQHVDAQSLLVQIYQLQKEHSKVKVSGHVLFELLFASDDEVSWYMPIHIDLKPFDKRLGNIVTQTIKNKNHKKLITILQRLQACNYTPYQQQIIRYIVQNNPSLLLYVSVVLSPHNMDQETIQHYYRVATKIMDSNPEKHYRFAYLLRFVLGKKQMQTIIARWLAHDPLYAQYRKTQNTTQKKSYQDKLLASWYSLGYDAKDYSPIFLSALS